jgi:hypothetical protein
VLRVEPGIGCHVRNLFTEETRLLADFGFAETARPGLVLATRLLDFGDYVATGGAPLPAGILDEDKLGEWQRRFSATPNDDRVDPAAMIRACLQKGASSSVRYEAPHGYRRSDAAGEFMPPRTSGRRRRAAAKLQHRRPWRTAVALAGVAKCSRTVVENARASLKGIKQDCNILPVDRLVGATRFELATSESRTWLRKPKSLVTFELWISVFSKFSMFLQEFCPEFCPSASPQ